MYLYIHVKLKIGVRRVNLVVNIVACPLNLQWCKSCWMFQGVCFLWMAFPLLWSGWTISKLWEKHKNTQPIQDHIAQQHRRGRGYMCILPQHTSCLATTEILSCHNTHLVLPTQRSCLATTEIGSSQHRTRVFKARPKPTPFSDNIFWKSQPPMRSWGQATLPISCAHVASSYWFFSQNPADRRPDL